ncbi:MAG: 1-acyl-sn-glycerol-3-phosphate acyltransferase [Spirochaetota bacterium]
MVPIRERYAAVAQELIRHSRQPDVITRDAVFQESNLTNRRIVESIVTELILPGSGIEGMENLEKLFALAQQGRPSLILMEHYSNFDIPCLYYLLKGEGEKGMAVADSIVSIAGMKLNEESRIVRAFSEAYTRIVIYPARSLERVIDPEEQSLEAKKAAEINHHATRHMIRLKHEGHIILVFPAGTRYRPGEPDTKRVLRTVDSYVRTFENMVMIGLAGNILRISPDGDMTMDLVTEDVVRLKVGPVLNCREFRREIREAIGPGEDHRGAVARRIEERLEELHQEADALRREIAAQKGYKLPD